MVRSLLKNINSACPRVSRGWWTTRSGMASQGAGASIRRGPLVKQILQASLGSRRGKKGSRSPDFIGKESSGRAWQESSYEPAWLDGKLNMLDTPFRGLALPASNTSLADDPGPPRVPTAQTVRKLCQRGQLSEAVDAVGLLVQRASRASTSLLYTVLKKCVAEKNLALGRRVHHLTVKIGCESNTFLANHILRMYASQGKLQEAKDVFARVAKPDAFLWSSMISAHAKHGEPKQAVQLYHQMRRAGVKPDGHVFVAALQACASVADLESGKQVHSDVVEGGVPPDLHVCSCLVDMYAKCGRFEDARRVFDGLATRDVVTWNAMIAGYAKCGMLDDARKLFDIFPTKDVVTWTAMISGYAKVGLLEEARRLFDSVDRKNVVTWNAMIAGYVEHGVGQEALALYARLKQEEDLSNGVTFGCLLNACGSMGALQQGKQLHSEILEKGLLAGDNVLGICLLDMYVKCGRLEDARKVFDSLPMKDVGTWTVMINGYGQSNEGRKAIECFEEMMRDDVEPDGPTFTCLLVACSHEGLVNEGRHYFNAMAENHGIMPTMEHCNCMVDLLGRAGHLDEAEDMLVSAESNDVGLMSLLYACRSHGDIERGTRCFESLVRLDAQRAAAYVLMANTYSDAGRWADVERIEALRKSARASKKPAMADIEIDKQIHTFVVGEKRDGISSKVRSMNVRLKEEGGHIPHTELVLKPLSEKEKEDDLCGHAEKLALAYGLLNTPDGTPLLVTKNLRMCRDCHSSTEIMSRIEKRDIVVRDAHRVHRFVGGSCRCGGRP